ncbi:unnamed protein product [Ectocarpus fasciculatus]
MRRHQSRPTSLAICATTIISSSQIRCPKQTRFRRTGRPQKQYHPYMFSNRQSIVACFSVLEVFRFGPSCPNSSFVHKTRWFSRISGWGDLLAVRARLLLMVCYSSNSYGKRKRKHRLLGYPYIFQ